MTEFINNAFAQLMESYDRTSSNQRAVLSQIGDNFQAAADESMKYLEDSMKTSMQYLSPYMSAGSRGAMALENLLGFNGAAVQKEYTQQILDSPYVQSQINLGQKVVQNSAAAKGMLGSGRVLEQLQQFGQEIGASQIQNVQNALLQLSQQGQQVSGVAASLNQQNAQAVTGVKQWGVEGKAAAMNQSAQVYTSSELGKANAMFQAALSGAVGPSTDPGTAAGVIGGGSLGWTAIMGAFL